MTAFEQKLGHTIRKCQHVCSFESAIQIHFYSSLAQSVEHAAVNRSVVGSSPTGGVFLCLQKVLQAFFVHKFTKQLHHTDKIHVIM